MSEQKILIVDDEAAIRTLLRCAVSAPGFSVYEADCGKAALSLAAQQGPFALVVSDILMPGMDGIELARKLTGAGKAQRFLFVSGYCDGEYMPERISEFPVSAFLPKPFSIPDLLHTFRELLEQTPAGVRAAAVRQKPSSSALRRLETPLDTVRTLRRKTRRLQAKRDALLEDASWALRTHALLLWQIDTQYAAIQAIQRRLPARRAML
jgi:CheY-like chemotaxis protein